MAKRNVGGQNLALNMKSTKFELSSKSLMLHSYIWTKEDLLKNSLQLLDSSWPLEPMRLLGVRMSNLRTVDEIKKDKSLNDFFGGKLTK